MPAGMATLAMAWATTLLASNALYVLFRETSGVRVLPWLLPAQVGALGLAVAICSFAPALRALRRYVLVLLTLDVGYLIAEAVKQSLAYADWERGASEPERIVADAVVKVIPAILMVVVALLGGATRESLYLGSGDISATARFPVLGRTSWRTAGPVLAVLIAGPLLLQLSVTVRPDPALASRASAVLPLALFFALVNAASEEVRFRAVPLAQLVPCLGRGQALLVAAALFGIAHYYGHPSGASGVALASIAGVLWGTAILDTKGLFWSWWTHGLQDVLILAAVAMAQ